MKQHLTLPLTALSCGLLGFALRLAQNKTGFEAASGLPVSGNLWGTLLLGLLAVSLVLVILLTHSLPAGAPRDPEQFAPAFSTQHSLPLNFLVSGFFLVILSGLLEIAAGAGLLPALREYDSAFQMALVSGSASRKLYLILGVTSAVSGACLLSAAPACRRSGSREANTPSRSVSGNLLLIPPVFLVIRLVVTYRQVSVIPSLMSYYVEILTLSALTLAFYRLSSFAFQSGHTRRFARYAVAAVILCITLLADQTSVCSILLYLGFALTLLAFLLLRLKNAANTQA